MTLPLRASADGRCLPPRESLACEPVAARRPTLVRRRRAPRRGIILMMSLSLLTLFLMMLVTLIVITGQYRQSARVQARMDRVGDPPHKITDLAARNLLVGSGSTASSVHGHEVLRDLYGGSWRGQVTSVYATAPGAEPLRLNPGSTPAFLTFEFRRTTPANYDLFNTSPGDYTGSLLTFVSGSARQNVSVRILEYVPPTASGGTGRFTIARTNPDDTDGLLDSATLGDAIAAGDTFVVNDRPLSGYGAGYGAVPDPDPTTPPNGTGLWGYNIAAQGNQNFVYQGNAGATPIPLALVPHYRVYDDAGLSLVGAGSLNEDYDAVDYQNMFLASVPPRALRADQIVPSFWRPELVNYWRHYTFNHDPATDPTGTSTPEISLWYQEGSTAGSRIADDLDTARARNDFYRRLFLRPLPTDHPEFTGSNPDFALPLAADHTDRTNMAKRLWQPLSLLTGINDINEDGVPDQIGAAPSLTWPPMPDTGPTALPLVDPLSDLNGNGIVDQWDVDNDGDGLTDSIWIDIGLPVQRMEDGKLYKPLVAYLIRDLDGLANVNAHLHPDFATAQQSNVTGPLAGTGAGTRPRGSGYGPAEIAYPSTGFGAAPYNSPLFNNAQVGQLLAGRYGYLGVDERPGRPGVNDLISRLRSPTLPPFVYNAVAVSEWGTPPDVWGSQAIALDYLGQPYNDRIGLSAQLQTHMAMAAPPFTSVVSPNGPTEGSDDPYEIDLYTAHAGAVDATLGYLSPDAPYTLGELERILRWNDSDAVYLPNRLAQAVDPAFNDADAAAALARRRAVTTHTSHIPAAPSAVPSERRIPDGTAQAIAPHLGTSQTWSLYHLFAQKLIANATTATGAPFNGTNSATPNWDSSNVAHRNWVDRQVRIMMPWESWHGMKMDLNRRWQNGFDDDSDGIVDEPDEVNVPETVFPNTAWTAQYGLGQLATYNQQFDHLGADPQFAATGSSNAVARQIYARHLYCTALLLMDYDANGTSGFGPQGMFDNADYDPDLTPAQMDELFKRHLAQWAINVVDYRDPDSICSPFEYDVNPYDGWQADIDGDPMTPVPPAPANQRRLVWGVEAPHLLITETLAMHNRRVVDSAHDTTMQTRQQGDNDLDQHRVPQGSLFLELYAVGTRAANDANVPAELYDRTDGQLVLSKVTPNRNDPVWRVAVSAPHDVSDTTEQRNSAFYRATQMRTTGGQRFVPTSFDPLDLNLLTLSESMRDPNNPAAAPAEPVVLERFVHFTNSFPTMPGNPATLANTFYYRSGTTKVAPGQYAVIAPRETTYLTLIDDDDETSPAVYDDGMGVEAAKLEVVGSQFFSYDNFHNAQGDYLHPDAVGVLKVVQPQAMVCAADAPAGHPQPIGMNISEPLPTAANYYLAPTDDPTNIGFNDGYAEGDGTEDTLPDAPFDSQPGMPLESLTLETQTKKNWRTVYLQRLANPLEDFHPTRNPYVTVDFAPVDLSIYNGEDRRPAGWNQTMHGQWDPADQQTNTSTNSDPFALASLDFMSRERGLNRGRTADSQGTYNEAATALNDGHFNLWRHDFADPISTQATPDTALGMTASGVMPEVKFRHNLLHTLGYLNVTMGMDSDPALTDYVAPPNANYRGAPPVAAGTQRTFPWLNWADRPFNSPFELLTIPYSSQATWFEDWSRDQVTSATPVQPFNGTPGATAIANFQGYYKHLWNFFHKPSVHRDPNSAVQSPQMARLFDYVETPSPFAGSQEFFSTGNMNLSPGFLRAGNSELSRFRDPGRVNLNTMPPVLWDSFNYSHGSRTPNNGDFRPSTTSLGAFAETRAGLPIGRPAGDQQTWQYPTRIARPYRSAGKADLAPLLPDRPGYAANRLRQFDVNATLLRSDELAKPAANPEQPLFAGPRHGEQFQHTDKNPYFRYEQLARLPNLTSTQSNVYAVWVTVGYFEAHKTSPDVRNPALAGVYAGQPLPDGVWLGQEIGGDTGRNRRHRAFYIIDRSIPTAFEPGNDHNAEKTILLRRYLD